MLSTKMHASTMVPMNMIFSDPRRFVLPVSAISLPPNALPTPASLRCKRIAMMMLIALATCIAWVMNCISIYVYIPYLTGLSVCSSPCCHLMLFYRNPQLPVCQMYCGVFLLCILYYIVLYVSFL